jgi:hypothetical protein
MARETVEAKSSLLIVQNDVVEMEAGFYPKMVIFTKS